MKGKRYSRLVLIALLLYLGGCRSTRDHDVPKYLFLITLDTTRADFIDYNLGEDSRSPHLAELANAGILFPNAYALIPITLPSHSAMFYSLPPHTLNNFNNGQYLDVSYPSVTQILRENGYQTGAVVSLGTVNARWGLGKGFDSYIENYRKPYVWYKTAEEVNQDAFELIKKLKDAPFFVWIHYSDPHEPYFPPKYGGKFTVTINSSGRFTSSSIERASVDVEFELTPGRNTIEMATTMSEAFRRDERLKLNRINYIDLKIDSDIPSERLEIVLPQDWKRTVLRSIPSHNTHKRKSVIAIDNKTRKTGIGRLTFVYRITPKRSSLPFLYQEEVRYMDHHIGELMEFIRDEGMYSESAFVIMGDHGEGLGEYRRHIGHISYLHKIYSKVPLMVLGPGIKEGIQKTDLVSNLNVAPTLLDIMNIEKPDFMVGDSLLRRIKEKKLLLETYSPEAIADSFAVIDYPYQFIFYPERRDDIYELFDLENDDSGLENLAQSAAHARRIRSFLDDIRKIAKNLLAMKSENSSDISEKDLKILRALGYIR